MAKGWIKENDEWKYKDNDGKYVVNKMVNASNKKAYLDENGNAVKQYLYKDEDGKIYYFDENCSMCSDIFIDVNKNTKSNFKIEFDATYHFGVDGVSDYYINKNSKEIRVLFDTWIYNSDNKWQYKTKNGNIKKDELIKTGRNIYYVDKNGNRVENYLLKDYKGSTFYFNSDGEMAKDVYVLVNQSTNSNKEIDGIYLMEFDCSGKLLEQTRGNKNSKVNRIVTYDARINKYDENITFKDEEVYSFDLLKEKIKNVNVDDKIKFGKYEQDGNNANGDELISWLVLDVDDESVTLISEYILDCLNFSTMYTNYYTDPPVEYLPKFFSTEMREFLNVEFLNKAFTNDEIRMIKTIDSSRVHLITLDEYIKYFGNEDIDGTNKNAIAKGTEYSILQGLDVAKKDSWYKGCGSYWLETYHVMPEGFADKVMWSGMYGHLYKEGQEALLKKGDGVRPLVVLKK